MLFFKRILKEPEPTTGPETAGAGPPVERRSARRFKIQPDSQLKAVLGLVGRDDTGAPMSHSRSGWNWRARLVDCSEHGVRLLMGSMVKAVVGDSGDLIIEMQGFHLKVPCHIANIREEPAGRMFGLKHEIDDAATGQAFRQFLEVVALGSTLRRQFKHTKVDVSGYLAEQYASDRPARLTIWRHEGDGTPAAFEFLLKDSLVRGAAGRELKYLGCTDGVTARPVAAAKTAEIRRLFEWVVPNLTPVVPLDVRRYLLHLA